MLLTPVSGSPSSQAFHKMSAQAADLLPGRDQCKPHGPERTRVLLLTKLTLLTRETPTKASISLSPVCPLEP